MTFPTAGAGGHEALAVSRGMEKQLMKGKISLFAAWPERYRCADRLGGGLVIQLSLRFQGWSPDSGKTTEINGNFALSQVYRIEPSVGVFPLVAFCLV